MPIHKCEPDCRCGKHSRWKPDTKGMSEIERFWASVEVKGENECWPWKFSLLKDSGYGQANFEGRKRCAHTVAAQLANADYDPSKETDHTCHNRACCNPKHLRPVTHKQNLENRRGPNVNSSTGIRGVRKYGNRWRADVKHNYVNFALGSFATKEEAEAAVIAKRKELFTHA